MHHCAEIAKDLVELGDTLLNFPDLIFALCDHRLVVFQLVVDDQQLHAPLVVVNQRLVVDIHALIVTKKNRGKNSDKLIPFQKRLQRYEKKNTFKSNDPFELTSSRP